MASYQKDFNRTSEYTRLYSGMRGVDFTGDGSRIASDHFAYLENMYRDYDGEGAALTESFPGFRRLYDFGVRIHGIYHHRVGGNDCMLVHAGTSLYRFAVSNRDAITAPTSLITMADADSRGFAFGENFYILDGTSYTEVDKNGNANRISRVVGHGPYVPTLYKNGEPYEQRNLLTDEFSEETEMATPELYAFGTEGLAYESDSEAPGCVVLVGLGSATATNLLIPAYVVFEGALCAVSRIGNGAFGANGTVTSVKVANGLSKIGSGAFASCTALTTVSLPDSVTHIEDGAFAGCTVLSSFTVGKGLSHIGTGVLTSCPVLFTIRYGGVSADIASIEGGNELHGRIPFTAGLRDKTITVKIPVYADALSAPYLYLNGTPVNATAHVTNNKVDYLLYSAQDRKNLVGARFKLYGALSSSTASSGERKAEKQDFFTLHAGLTGDLARVITHCTVCAVFDGRIFFSGNSLFPGTVFYTERDDTGSVNPTYFGAYNYFTDGVGPSPVTSLLPVGDTLAVFRQNDDGGGSIFYHTPKATGENYLVKIYPFAYVHHGIAGIGESHSFYDDAVFITGQGVCALEKDKTAGECRVLCRSHNVSDKLLCENLNTARLTKWCGYLCLLLGSHMYLADSRQTFRHPTGSTEYEWYYVTGVGTYASDVTVYRYFSVTESGYDEAPHPDGKVTGSVQSETVGGVSKYYVTEGTKKYQVYPTEEKTGGVFSPAVTLCAFDSFLFFGTESGSLCLFNNDLRGVAPSYIANAADFDAASYAEKYKRRIHPHFYTNDHHAMHFVLKTAMDNGGMPHLSKDSVRHSLVLKCRATGADALNCEVRTDREGTRTITSFPEDSFDFTDLNFASLTMDTEESFTVPIDEKSKRWTEKQLTFFADGVFCPVGIFSIAYRYRIRGNIKKI